MYKICGVHFFCFRPEKPWLSKSDQKNQNCSFKLKFGVKTNLNMRNSMMMFTFSVFDHKYLSWATLFQKFEIVQSKIWYKDELEYAKFKQLPFLGKFGPKNRNCQFKLKIGTKTNANMKNSIVMFIFLFSTEVYFFQICAKNQNYLLKLKFRI